MSGVYHFFNCQCCLLLKKQVSPIQTRCFSTKSPTVLNTIWSGQMLHLQLYVDRKLLDYVLHYNCTVKHLTNITKYMVADSDLYGRYCCTDAWYKKYTAPWLLRKSGQRVVGKRGFQWKWGCRKMRFGGERNIPRAISVLTLGNKVVLYCTV